mmetsp:Transcript_24010/g.56672  ORF Transcript_24010/g.56672 Transcript_24010/m.56672 type:complete len:225 (+) Transcript_24010:1551-2225(+)
MYHGFVEYRYRARGFVASLQQLHFTIRNDRTIFRPRRHDNLIKIACNVPFIGVGQGKFLCGLVEVDPVHLRVEEDRSGICVEFDRILRGALDVPQYIGARDVGRHGFSKVLVEGVLRELEDLLRGVDPHPVVHSLPLDAPLVGFHRFRLPQAPAPGVFFEDRRTGELSEARLDLGLVGIPEREQRFQSAPFHFQLPQKKHPGGSAPDHGHGGTFRGDHGAVRAE